MKKDGLVLRGPDGCNPLGFLSAIGTLRVANTVWPGREVRMSWTTLGTGWRPVLHARPGLEPEELVLGLHRYSRWGLTGPGVNCEEAPTEPADAFPLYAFDRNTSKIEPDRFRELELQARDGASQNRSDADFVAALGCSACVDDGYTQDTAFRTMSGAGHQHFLGTMLNLVELIEPQHIQSSLLDPWNYEDPQSRLSMRWDPADQSRYALRWSDPSSDPARGRRGSMLGANRLAVEALPLFPTAPVVFKGRAQLATTGFETGPTEPFWTWPIWEPPLSVDVCASLLAHPLVQELGRSRSRWDQTLAHRETLRRMGVVEAFRSRRIAVDYYRNFAPARAV